MLLRSVFFISNFISFVFVLILPCSVIGSAANNEDKLPWYDDYKIEDIEKKIEMLSFCSVVSSLAIPVSQIKSKPDLTLHLSKVRRIGLMLSSYMVYHPLRDVKYISNRYNMYNYIIESINNFNPNITEEVWRQSHRNLIAESKTTKKSLEELYSDPNYQEAVKKVAAWSGIVGMMMKYSELYQSVNSNDKEFFIYIQKKFQKNNGDPFFYTERYFKKICGASKSRPDERFNIYCESISPIISIGNDTLSIATTLASYLPIPAAPFFRIAPYVFNSISFMNAAASYKFCGENFSLSFATSTLGSFASTVATYKNMINANEFGVATSVLDEFFTIKNW